MRAVRISEDSSLAEFDRLREQERFVSAVEEGLADADAGQLRDHDDVVARMRARLGEKREFYPPEG